ncbi:hypothetical protein BO82DRAFT_400298 [Aspergillus uvarum CBS 121591]|uniref:Uncharacterized protein n=1 Tax=Aspergillus uvarum CBS 121591 TaxID=1448315 RepID=A0A319CGI6_9EURO|nr:hypothetical protein BO82DRAFT_400298 [Aspergillus uvarum CBS 121591]PYH83540.1 hypothetical protein BO82DRAFT_400298 [Aspergillus uvarum CBS 121591]
MATGNSAMEFLVTSIHLDAIARYLVVEAFVANFYIWCGYRVSERQWKVIIMFNKKDISKEAAAEARQTILSRFLLLSQSLGEEDIEPEWDQAVKLRQTPGVVGTVTKWIRPKGWRHMTKLVGSHGHFFVPVRNRVDDMAEQHACAREASEGTFAGWFIRGLWALLPGGRRDRADLTLDEAIAKMEQ